MKSIILISLLASFKIVAAQVIPISFIGDESSEHLTTFFLPNDTLKGLPKQKLIIEGKVELTNQKDKKFTEFSTKGKVVIVFDTIEFRSNSILLTKSDLIIYSKVQMIGNVNIISNRGINGINGINGNSLDLISKSINGDDGNEDDKNGKKGSNGKIGELGKRGGNGYKSSNITIYLNKLDSNATLNIKANGGHGGNGGDGNNGGEGGNGGIGMHGSKSVGINGGNAGNGGNGGRGGDGGYGGDGGDAGLIQIIATSESYYVLSTKDGLIKYSSKGGIGGHAGIEGKGGAPGLSGLRGKGISIKDSTGKIIKGKNGINGKMGRNGVSGEPGKNGRNGKSYDLKLILQTEKNKTNDK